MMTSDELKQDVIHQQRLRDDSDYRSKCINERNFEKMNEGGECYPWTAEHVGEALSELDNDELAQLAVSLKHREVVQTERMLSAMINLYWFSLADMLTKRELGL